MPDTKTKILLGRKGAAELLDCSIRTIDYLVADKKLNPRRVRGKVCFLVSELESKAKNNLLR